MNVFEKLTDMGHEQVLFCHDPQTNLKAIIALHDTGLGLAMGATRLWPYGNEQTALRDALRLSRGMTYKAACCNIPVGGGKAVIMANPEQKTEAMLRSYAHFINNLKGRFVTGQDVNLSPSDVRIMHQETPHVVGMYEKGGGPAVATALGVILGMKASMQFRWQTTDLSGLKVAVQGLGNVGKYVCQYLAEEGAQLFVTDLGSERMQDIEQSYGATVVKPDQIYGLEVDIFAPCALGGILNNSTISQLKAKIIAGSANNQLENEKLHSLQLASQDILYCPDYVINGGGLINVYNEMIGYDHQKTLQHIQGIYPTLLEIFAKAKTQNITTHKASQELAEERIKLAKSQRCQLQAA